MREITTDQNRAAPQKPDCPLIGQDGNIFNLMGIAANTLQRNGLDEQAKEMFTRILHGDCHSYEEALAIIGEYVNITESEQKYDEGPTMGGMSHG